MNQFENLVLNLNWQGAAADTYKEDVISTITLLRSQLTKLENLANEPLKKAELMQQADSQEAQKIRNKFLV